VFYSVPHHQDVRNSIAVFSASSFSSFFGRQSITLRPNALTQDFLGIVHLSQQRFIAEPAPQAKTTLFFVTSATFPGGCRQVSHLLFFGPLSKLGAAFIFIRLTQSWHTLFRLL